tara:strand:+ start:1008 stop:2171 length:1164 start_codon:yes stop_codon:yes gene_type:complete
MATDKMKKTFYIALFFMVISAQAQTALYNSGNLRIHEDGHLGFHTNLINDGVFDENSGLAGFYGIAPLTISGALPPTLFDVEISNDTNVGLNTVVNVSNNLNFIVGDFFTPKDEPQYYLNFLADSFYTGESDISKVNGYATVTDLQNFTFPVGDGMQVRPLVLRSQSVNTLAKCAYFFENPNNPSTFTGTFDTERRPPQLGSVSTREFWRLEGDVPSTVQITWNGRSNMGEVTDDVSKIVVVGFSKTTGRWEILAGGAAAGDLTEGLVVSALFVPDEYEALTFGATGEPRDYLTLDNYLVTPNGDGRNEALEIPELELSPNNHLQIYDRFGLKVFEMSNYTNQFVGYSNVNNFVIGRDEGLPEGVYFYVVSLKDLELDFQGFFYLAR